MNRNHTTLAILLIVQVALILLVRSPFSGGTSASESRPLLPMLEALTPMQIELLGNEDRRVTLIKEAGGWQLGDLDGFPADDEKIEQLIDDLRALTIRRPVVTSKRYHASFKVADDENQGRVRLWDNPAEDPAIELIMGSSSNYRALHVRLEGTSEVYEVRDLAAYDVRADPEAWIEKDLVDVPEGQLVNLAVTNANGSFELIRQDGQWSAEGSEAALNSDEVDSLVRAASSIQLAKPAGLRDAAAHGYAAAAATVTLRYRPPGEPDSTDVREIVVTVGAKPDADSSERYITRSDFEFSGVVWESSIRALLESTLDGLVDSDEDGDGDSESDGDGAVTG
jgi:hypothetical protein